MGREVRMVPSKMNTKHRTKDGRLMDISEMSNNHLINTMCLWEKKARDGIIVPHGGGMTPDEMWYDEDHLYGEEALQKLNYYAYVEEAKRRALLY